MMRSEIPIFEFSSRIFSLFEETWLLLTCGDYKTGDFNAMTIAWGSLGVMWSRPFAQVVVRPTRYTYQFMEKYPDFTLTAFEKPYRPALSLLGTKSGRDMKKIAASGLTPIPSTKIDSPGYAEANLIIECRRIYWSDFAPQTFTDPTIDQNYPQKDYHRSYFGEILVIFGEEKYHQFPTP